MLDFCQPQERQARGRAQKPFADLPDGLRGAGTVTQHHLHRCRPEPTGNSRCELVFRDAEGAKFFLVGSDYVWPHCVNEIIKDQLKALGAECVGESYVLFGTDDVGPSVEAIKKANPDVIISTVVGNSNKPFYERLQAAGIPPSRIPVLSFSIAEDELRSLPLRDMVGDYAAWDYFQSIERPENKEFVEKFKTMYGPERVVSDVMEAAYCSVLLWAQAVEEAQSEEVARVLKAIRRQSLNAPEGIVSVDDETQHTWRPVFVGQIRADGQFDLVWKSEKPVRPIPYPSSRSHAEWDAFLEGLYKAWGGWANPGPRSTARSDENTSGLTVCRSTAMDTIFTSFEYDQP